MKLITTNMRYITSRLSKYLLTGILALTFVCCKTQKSEKEKLMDELSKFVNLELTNDTKAIILINDNGCTSCNQKFCDIMAKQINNIKCRFIVSANPNGLDFSAFLNNKNPAIFIDKHQVLGRTVKFASSTFFSLSNKNIDTLIEINPNEYESKINFILSQIN